MPSILNATTTSGLVTSADNSGSLQLQTNNGTTAVTIDTSQNVGIGTSSPASKLQVVGQSGFGNGAANSAARVGITQTGNDAVTLELATGSGSPFDVSLFAAGASPAHAVYLNNRNDAPMVFQTNNTERMRITSGGDALVGRTTTGFDKTAYGWQISRDAESFVTVNTAASCITFNRNNTGDIFKFFRDGTQRGWISVETTGTTFGNLSDRRVKENFADAPEALSKINNVKVQSFDWKEGGHTDYGFVAQDLNTVFPFAVTVGDNGEEVEKAWGVDNTKIVPVLVKAIQEQQAQIEELKAEVQALKE